MEIIKASLDRFEGDIAVIYSDLDKRRFDVPKELVNAKAGSRVLVHLNDNNQVVKVDFDEQRTKEARPRIKDKYHRLLRGEHISNSDR